MPEYNARLTHYHYGGHRAVSDDHDKDHDKRASGDVMPASHANQPAQPYVRYGLNEPVGVERYGMYGVAAASPANRAFAEPVAGLYDGDGVRTGAWASEARLIERFEMQVAEIIEPGIVAATISEGVCTLRGTVRDAATRARIEAIADQCLSACTIRSELRAATTPMSGAGSDA